MRTLLGLELGIGTFRSLSGLRLEVGGEGLLEVTTNAAAAAALACLRACAVVLRVL